MLWFAVIHKLLSRELVYVSFGPQELDQENNAWHGKDATDEDEKNNDIIQVGRPQLLADRDPAGLVWRSVPILVDHVHCKLE